MKKKGLNMREQDKLIKAYLKLAEIRNNMIRSKRKGTLSEDAQKEGYMIQQAINAIDGLVKKYL